MHRRDAVIQVRDELLGAFDLYHVVDRGEIGETVHRQGTGRDGVAFVRILENAPGTEADRDEIRDIPGELEQQLDPLDISGRHATSFAPRERSQVHHQLGTQLLGHALSRYRGRSDHSDPPDSATAPPNRSITTGR